jgi:hypothetical protein
MEILVEGSRYPAEHIPGARSVESPGLGRFPLTSERAISDVGSTEHLARLGDHDWRELLERCRTVSGVSSSAIAASRSTHSSRRSVRR